MKSCKTGCDFLCLISDICVENVWNHVSDLKPSLVASDLPPLHRSGTSAISNMFYTCQGLHFCHLAVAPISLDSCLSPQKYSKPCLRVDIKPSLVARDLPPLEWHRRHLWRTPSQPLMCHQTIFLQPRRQICAKMCAISNKLCAISNNFCAISNKLCACHSVKGCLSTSWVGTCVTWQLRPSSYLLPVFPIIKVFLGSGMGYLGRQRYLMDRKWFYAFLLGDRILQSCLSCKKWTKWNLNDVQHIWL